MIPVPVSDSKIKHKVLIMGFMVPVSAEEESRAKALASVSKMGDYLPRLTLYTSKATAVIKRQIPSSHYGLETGGSEGITDLGEEITVGVISGRAKALDTKSDGMICILHDEDDPEFQRIKQDSFIKDSGCMYGPEYLCYLPGYGYVTWFLGTKTLRFSSGKMLAMRGKCATLSWELIEKKDNCWEGPTINESVVDIGEVDPDEMEKERLKFMNEKSTRPAPKAPESSRKR